MTTSTANAPQISVPQNVFRECDLTSDTKEDCCTKWLNIPATTPLPDLPRAYMNNANNEPMPYSLKGVMMRAYCFMNGCIMVMDRGKEQTLYGYNEVLGTWSPLTLSEMHRRIEDVMTFIRVTELPTIASGPMIDSTRKFMRGFDNAPEKYRKTFSFASNIVDVRTITEEHEFDADREKLACKNGVIDLRSGKLLPHSPDFLNRIRSEVTFIPGFTCDMFERFKNRIFEGKKDPAATEKYVQSVVGATMTGHAKDKLLVRLYSAHADTGKTTFLEAMATCLGKYAMSAEPEVLLSGSNDNNRAFTMAEVFRKRMIYMSETDEDNSGFRLSAASVKKFVGTDTQRARRPCELPFDFVPEYTAWVATNCNTKMTSGGDDAFWKRVKTIDFGQSIVAGKDVRFREAAGDPESDFLKAMLAWAVEGAVMYLTNGGVASESVDVQEATQKYRDDVNMFFEFFEDLDFSDPHAFTTVPMMRKLFLDHDSIHDMAYAPKGGSALAKALTDKLNHGTQVMRLTTKDGKKKTKPTRVWIGVKPKTYLVDPEENQALDHEEYGVLPEEHDESK